ncbi:cytochrome P450 [Nocardia colli]|uniref:Cytochrome P450 n=1 Tax=Nocardia colli TaxID=2545717 RepID=A0A5N0E9U5_9NOCA|nr:cytochrome P450 [Nocardia colli]KAA8886202.1 cytochrome P450 [Nocardia colli]
MTDPESIPVAPGRRLGIGHASEFLNDPIGFISALASHGPLWRVHLGPQTVVVVCEQSLIGKVLLDDRAFDKGGPFYERTREVAGSGLGSCPHEHHRRLRRLCEPAFQMERIRGYSRIMASSIENSLAGWRDGKIIDLTAEMTELAVNIAVRTMFSTSLNGQAIHETSRDLDVITQGLFRRTVLPPVVSRLPTSGTRRFQQARRRIRRLAVDIIAERRAEGGVDHGDLLSAFLAARDVGSTRPAMTEAELIDQVFTFLLSGTETTASAICWALYSASMDPALLNELQTEVDSVLAGGTAQFEDLDRMPVVGRVLTEALRMYPPGWMVTRIASRDTELDGYRIPAGTVVAISPHAIHRSLRVYAHSNKFLPDRWAVTGLPSASYLPFGAGARRCIGDVFALTEAGMVAATITAKWCLAPSVRLPGTVSFMDLPAPRSMLMEVSARRVERRVLQARNAWSGHMC